MSPTWRSSSSWTRNGRVSSIGVRLTLHRAWPSSFKDRKVLGLRRSEPAKKVERTKTDQFRIGTVRVKERRMWIVSESIQRAGPSSADAERRRIRTKRILACRLVVQSFRDDFSVCLGLLDSECVS